MNAASDGATFYARVAGYEHCSHVLAATARLPAQCLREPLQTIERCFENKADAKYACNALIGLFCKRPRAYSSQHKDYSTEPGPQLRPQSRTSCRTNRTAQSS